MVPLLNSMFLPRRNILHRPAKWALKDVRKKTGMPISEALKRGLRSLRDQVDCEVRQTPWEVNWQIEQAPGGSSIGSSTNVRRAVREAVRKKIGR